MAALTGLTPVAKHQLILREIGEGIRLACRSPTPCPMSAYSPKESDMLGGRYDLLLDAFISAKMRMAEGEH
ncbi:MAG: hypothetical protein C4519_18940 [Desulfobacteraceae bacterium]|nr:MAG: hypothetical protein C4519_18940 [Desulfobacteraceae bacterium]